MFSLESPHQGNSNEYTQHTIINIKLKITLNYPKYNNVCSYGIFLVREFQNEFKIAVVDEPSVFEPLKFYCLILSPCRIGMTVPHPSSSLILNLEMSNRS